MCFAGEVFPTGYLRQVMAVWPGRRFLNLYGPTETNVCTFFVVPEVVPADRVEPYPIGQACSGDRTKVVGADGCEVAAGEAGELLVAGGSVMQGYWGLPERTAEAFTVDADGTRWYATGDLVRADESENYEFLGRRDRMIKRRGYRIEPGEIESVLYTHPDVVEAAVIDVSAPDGSTRIRAFVSIRGDERPSLIAFKGWCATNLPGYMVPDEFAFEPSLPKTSTDKVDYQALRQRN